jgi:hypothetical protein
VAGVGYTSCAPRQSWVHTQDQCQQPSSSGSSLPSSLAPKKVNYVGEGFNLTVRIISSALHFLPYPDSCYAPVLSKLRLDDLFDLYRRVFGRILSREDAKASPYSRYYVTINTAHPWKHILADPSLILESWKTALQKVSPYQLSHPRMFAISVAHSFSADDDVSFLSFLRASMIFGASQNIRGERAAVGIGTTTGGIGRLGRRWHCHHICKDAVDTFSAKLVSDQVLPRAFSVLLL